MALETTAYKATKRTVEYAQTRHLSDYLGDELNPAWVSWLRHTRDNPPTMQELQIDHQRRISLNANVAKLDEKDRQDREKRLALEQRASLPQQEQQDLPGSTSPQESTQLRQAAIKEMQRKKREMNKSPLEAFTPAGSSDYQPQAWAPGPARKRS